jgi:hypothetical protein
LPAAVARKRKPLRGTDKIALRAGPVLARRKMAKHFELTITDTSLAFTRNVASIAREAALDGIYVLRTNLLAAVLDTTATVLAYKGLAAVERAFRSIKTIDLQVRPIHHHLADRVRAHVFLYMPAYYLIWHMRQAWAELLFGPREGGDHDRPAAAAARSSPVAAAEVSPAAPRKAAQANRRRLPGTQLPHPAARSRHPKLQHRPPRRRTANRHARPAHRAPAACPRQARRRHRNLDTDVGRTDPGPAAFTKAGQSLTVFRQGKFKSA